jgi:hypothetical protein
MSGDAHAALAAQIRGTHLRLAMPMASARARYAIASDYVEDEHSSRISEAIRFHLDTVDDADAIARFIIGFGRAA